LILIHSNFHDASINLAVEEYLFSHRSEEILFLYVNEPCVVVGRNQDVLSEVDKDFCAENRIPVFKRISGGGTVYHDRGNLNYCFISDRIQGESPLNDGFLQPIVDVLAALQVQALIGNRKDLWLSGGHKISGTASHVGKTRILHHGTLLYDADLNKLEKCLAAKSTGIPSRAIASVPSPVKNIRLFLKERNCYAPDAENFFGLLIQKFLDLYCLDAVSGLRSEEISGIKPLSPAL
jgi:lipoate---protein ligase